MKRTTRNIIVLPFWGKFVGTDDLFLIFIDKKLLEGGNTFDISSV